MPTVLLRESEKRLYYGRQGRWVPEVSAALIFETIGDALLFNRQHHLHKTEIVLQHSEPGKKTVLPIGNRAWGAKRWDGF
jgi:hypothetical protein